MVITFENYRPVPRYDDLPWTEARIEEATTATGSWTAIETQALDPVDVDPENPATRDFTTEEATDTPGLWYRIIFVDGNGEESLPTAPVQNGPAGSTYATVSELMRILKIRQPTPDQEIAAQRVLLAAAGEIDSEVGSSDELTGWQLALVQEVNLERAVEHWRQQEAPFGLLGLGTEFGGGAERTAQDSWNRHANKLAPLKAEWGIA